ncbi:MAG: hypothetical protein A3F91_11240 [Flavobacteria bacterium RIFCSPLOWO2_12_FULL_35_11]|nr:MAG: hypothetical protein A3F91_11240 [Flavobacteria bacterium RIFCSPLOWO2_12_FULL_35_11]
MLLLVRKINRNKWPDKNSNQDVFDVELDAITNCLKSSKNTLSVWEINTENDLDEAVLALVSNFQHLEAIDVIIINGSELIKDNVMCVQTKGITPVKDLENSHYDLSELNFYTAGLIAEHIVKRIKIEKLKRYTIYDLKQILLKAISNKRVLKEDLSESLANKL